MGEGVYLLIFIAAERVAELALAKRNTAQLLRDGAVEYGAGHYPLIVAFHIVWLLGLFWFGHDREVDLFWFGAFAVLQAGRLWVLASLSRNWTTRIIVMPGRNLVATGPYRWLRHPNYLVVALEIAVVPLALGLPVYALIFSAANAAILFHRIRVENAALAQH